MRASCFVLSGSQGNDTSSSVKRAVNRNGVGPSGRGARAGSMWRARMRRPACGGRIRTPRRSASGARPGRSRTPRPRPWAPSDRNASRPRRRRRRRSSPPGRTPRARDRRERHRSSSGDSQTSWEAFSSSAARFHDSSRSMRSSWHDRRMRFTRLGWLPVIGSVRRRAQRVHGARSGTLTRTDRRRDPRGGDVRAGHGHRHPGVQSQRRTSRGPTAGRRVAGSRAARRVDGCRRSTSSPGPPSPMRWTLCVPRCRGTPVSATTGSWLSTHSRISAVRNLSRISASWDGPAADREHEEDPGPMSIRGLRDSCARGDLNPHALSGTSTSS